VNNTNLTTNVNNTNVENNIDGDVTNNYSETYTEVNNGGTITNVNQTINNTSVYAPLGCSGAQALPYNGVTDPLSTKVEATVSYDSQTKLIELLPTQLTKTVTVTDGTFTATRDNALNTIVVTKDAGALVGTVDVCEFSGGMTINNNGTVENNTNVSEYYDENSSVVNEGDVYNENLTINNISYAESYVAGEALTNRQPLRLGVLSLGEDVDKVYGANATDADHSGFIGFASKAVAAGGTLAVLQ